MIKYHGTMLTKEEIEKRVSGSITNAVLLMVAVPANMIILIQRPYAYEIWIDFFKMCSLGVLLFRKFLDSIALRIY